MRDGTSEVDHFHPIDSRYASLPYGHITPGWPNYSPLAVQGLEYRQMSQPDLLGDQPSFGALGPDLEISSSRVSTDSSSYSSVFKGLNPPTSSAVAAVAAANASLVSHPTQINNPRDFTSAPSRTVYLGNIPPNLQPKELLDHIRCGVVEEVKVLHDKNCAFVSFLDKSSALLFHSDAILRRLIIDGRDIKVGWGKPKPLEPLVALATANEGATRNVFIGRLNTPHSKVHSLEECITESQLLEDMSMFGEVENIKIIENKGIAFVHFTSILSAIKAVSNIASMNHYYVDKKLFYGKDRCAFISKAQKHNAAQFLGIQPGNERAVSYSDRDFIANTLLQQSAAAAAIATAAGGANNLGNRTIYLGNLPKDVKIEEVCNVIRGGLLQNIKLLTDRNVCFVTFIDPTAAAQFYAMTSLHGLTLKSKRAKIGWGKHSGPLPNALALAVSHGASRNIYIGNINFAKHEKQGEPIITEDYLRAVFQEFGEVEQINFLWEKSCCFVNFTNIENAITALEKVKGIAAFDNVKINFGKDRCASVARHFR
ncbi:LAMI_0D10044g1_1 [Lachancea mirantina]|uniref:LAMI_0D10044g1_1 n=1 Tax=Lachancea mirantina TaxID=1230905 RepID=A0A1G4JEN5_9SACH|nr:LAMI_0D10044g1_1 [Lachancea mirantina]